MKYLVIILLTLFIGCSNRPKNVNKLSNVPSNESYTEDSFKPDSSFDSFVMLFGFNPEFQKQRIKFPLEFINLNSKSKISADSWICDRLFVDLASITNVANGLETNVNSNERVFSWNYTKSGINKNYYFSKIKNKWFLIKIAILKDSIDPSKEDFYSFLSKFCKDSIFQKQRIKFPVEMVYLDNDFKEVKENREQEKWKFTRIYQSCDSIATTYFDFLRTFKDTDIRILEIEGVENGIAGQITFKRINNEWVMIKIEDYST
jgi:hypothetical protein